MRQSKLIIWLTVGVVILVLLNLPNSVSRSIKGVFREALSPMQVALANAWDRLSEQVGGVQRMPSLASENARLLLELERVNTEKARLQILAVENAALAAQLGYLQRSTRELIPCRVIGRTRDGWWQTLTLDKGSDHGLAEQMAVITVDGLIGKTVEVSRKSALVLLISDPSLKVAVRLPERGAFGILSGRGPSWDGEVISHLEFINRRVGMVVGDKVVTSGLGGIFPPDLPVGTVRSFATDPSGLYQTAQVVTQADLGNLQSCFVVAERPVAPISDEVEP